MPRPPTRPIKSAEEYRRDAQAVRKLLPHLHSMAREATLEAIETLEELARQAAILERTGKP